VVCGRCGPERRVDNGRALSFCTLLTHMAERITVVQRLHGSGATRYAVEADGHRYHVGVSDADVRRLAPGAAAADLVRESFVFLLEREPASSILQRFDLPVIQRYFPEYSEAMRRRFSSTGP